MLRRVGRTDWHTLFPVSRSGTGFLSRRCQRSEKASEGMFLLVVQVFESFCQRHVCKFIIYKQLATFLIKSNSGLKAFDRKQIQAIVHTLLPIISM